METSLFYNMDPIANPYCPYPADFLSLFVHDSHPNNCSLIMDPPQEPPQKSPQQPCELKRIESISQMKSYFNFNINDIRLYLDSIVKQLTNGKEELNPVELGIKVLLEDIIWHVLQLDPKTAGKHYQYWKAKMARYQSSARNALPDPRAVACFWNPEEKIVIAEMCAAVGYILSATVIHPNPPTARFYFSLLSMYAKWCATISTALSFQPQSGQFYICPPPSMCSMMYVVNGSKQTVDAVLLGSTMNGSWGENAISLYKNIRRPFMTQVYQNIDTLMAPLSTVQTGQSWGDCGETYPFLLMSGFFKNFNPKESNSWIYGKSIRVPQHLKWVGKKNDRRQVVWNGMAAQSDMPDIELIAKVPICEVPCENCVLLIQTLAPGGYKDEAVEGFKLDLDRKHWGMEIGKEGK